MPLASAVVGPRVAAPLLLVIDGVASLPLLPGAWRLADRREALTMAAGALVGVPLGAWVLARADPVTVRWGIAILVLLLLALLASGWRYRGRPAAALTAGVGGLAGLLSGAAQVGGPPVVAYWLGGGLPAASVRANVVVYFALSSALAAASYLASGLLTATVLGLALAAGPAYAVGLYAGARLFGRASEATFRRVCYALIAAAAVLSLPALDGVLR